MAALRRYDIADFDDYQELLRIVEPSRVHISEDFLGQQTYLVGRFTIGNALYVFSEKMKPEEISDNFDTMRDVTKLSDISAIEGQIIESGGLFLHYFGSPKPKSQELSDLAVSEWKKEVAGKRDDNYMVVFKENEHAMHVHLLLPRGVFSLPVNTQNRME